MVGAAVRDVRPPARHRSLRLGREGLWGGMDLGPGALTSAGMLMSPPAHTRPVADGDLPVAGARFDAFVSYRRIAEDTAFVDRLQAALAGRGKKVWVDRAEIEPASDWSERIARGIEATKAFVYVITPESVASQECRREYSMAVRRNKLVIPVVLRDLGQHPDLPEDLARLNWIFFSRGHDFEQALDEVIVALEEDLDWRDAHTRLGVRAGEWTGSRDRSFLLRGSDLRSAEAWLGQAAQHEKTPPTALQTEYILASRKNAVRTQRTWRAALSAGLVVALLLAAVAFVQRNDARSAARQADSRAQAAEATADLSSDPEQSLKLALSSMQIEPNGPGEQALRLALAHDRLRMAISTGTGPNTLATWNSRLDQVAVTAPHDSVALWNAATGRLTQVLPTGHAVNQILYDPSGSRLAAVSSAGYLTVWGLSASGVASPLPTSQLNTEVQALIPAYAKAAGGLLMSGVWANDGSDEFYIYAVSLPEILAFAPGSGVIVPVLRVPAHDGIWTAIPSPDGSGLFVDGLDSGSILDLATGLAGAIVHPAGLAARPGVLVPGRIGTGQFDLGRSRRSGAYLPRGQRCAVCADADAGRTDDHGGLQRERRRRLGGRGRPGRERHLAAGWRDGGAPVRAQQRDLRHRVEPRRALPCYREHRRHRAHLGRQHRPRTH